MCRRQRGVVQTCPKANRKYSHRCSFPCTLDRHKSQLHIQTHTHTHTGIHMSTHSVFTFAFREFICLNCRLTFVPSYFFIAPCPTLSGLTRSRLQAPTCHSPNPLATRCSYLNLTCLTRKLQLQSCVRSRFFLSMGDLSLLMEVSHGSLTRQIEWLRNVSRCCAKLRIMSVPDVTFISDA